MFMYLKSEQLLVCVNLVVNIFGCLSCQTPTNEFLFQGFLLSPLLDPTPSASAIFNCYY